MKFQILFSGKNKKNILICHLLKISNVGKKVSGKKVSGKKVSEKKNPEKKYQEKK